MYLFFNSLGSWQYHSCGVYCFCVCVDVEDDNQNNELVFLHEAKPSSLNQFNLTKLASSIFFFGKSALACFIHSLPERWQTVFFSSLSMLFLCVRHSSFSCCKCSFCYYLCYLFVVIVWQWIKAKKYNRNDWVLIAILRAHTERIREERKYSGWKWGKNPVCARWRSIIPWKINCFRNENRKILIFFPIIAYGWIGYINRFE